MPYKIRRAAPDANNAPLGDALSGMIDAMRNAQVRSRDPENTHTWEEIMDTKLYLTIAAVVAILYGIAFVLIPGQLGDMYGIAPGQPNAILNAQFFGSALLEIGVVAWFAREFKEWLAVRAVLIGAVVGDVVGGAINILGDYTRPVQLVRLVVCDCVRSAIARSPLLPVYRPAQDGLAAPTPRKGATTGETPTLESGGNAHSVWCCVLIRGYQMSDSFH
jgi:hypothetical protein